MDLSSPTMKSWQRLSSSSVVTPGWTKGSIMSSTLAAKRPASRILFCSSADFMVTLMVSWYKARLFLTTPHACRHNRPGARKGSNSEALSLEFKLPGLPIGIRGGSTQSGVFYDQRVNATDAGSGRPFRTPNPLLEPKDGPLHLR